MKIQRMVNVIGAVVISAVLVPLAWDFFWFNFRIYNKVSAIVHTWQ